jgi:hypothetical protein
MKLIAAAMISAAAILAAAGPAAAQTGARSCLRNSQIDSFSPVPGDLRSVIVIDKFRDKYKLSFNSVCQDIDYNGAVAIRTHSNFGLSCVERGDTVISRSTAGWRDRCVVTKIERYTPAMERADAEAAHDRRDSYRR